MKNHCMSWGLEELGISLFHLARRSLTYLETLARTECQLCITVKEVGPSHLQDSLLNSRMDGLKTTAFYQKCFLNTVVQSQILCQRNRGAIYSAFSMGAVSPYVCSLSFHSTSL